MSEEIVQIALPKTEQKLLCDCFDEEGDQVSSNITTTQLNDVEGIQECSECLRFSKFPL